MVRGVNPICPSGRPLVRQALVKSRHLGQQTRDSVLLSKRFLSGGSRLTNPNLARDQETSKANLWAKRQRDEDAASSAAETKRIRDNIASRRGAEAAMARKKNETRQRSETRAACARERGNTSRAAAVYKAPQLPAVLLARAARLQKKRELKTQVLEQRDETAAMEMAAKRAISPCEFTRCAGRRKQLERPYQLLVTVPTSTATLVVQLPNGRGSRPSAISSVPWPPGRKLRWRTCT
jgi:hypothetical protein